MTQKLWLIVAMLFSFPSHHVAWGTTDEQTAVERRERSECMQEYADKQLVRPSPKERVALIKLLEQKPRPKTFIDPDIKYLRSLLEKAVWTGAERRILREIWQEVTGQTLDIQPSAASDGK
ncbi:MAG: hypothetical protein ACREJU_20665 [Nitrospiraceae bacterium]